MVERGAARHVWAWIGCEPRSLAAVLAWWKTAGVAAPPATLQRLVVLQAEESRPRIRQLGVGTGALAAP